MMQLSVLFPYTGEGLAPILGLLTTIQILFGGKGLRSFIEGIPPIIEETEVGKDQVFEKNLYNIRQIQLATVGRFVFLVCLANLSIAIGIILLGPCPYFMIFTVTSVLVAIWMYDSNVTPLLGIRLMAVHIVLALFGRSVCLIMEAMNCPWLAKTLLWFSVFYLLYLNLIPIRKYIMLAR